MSLMLTDSLSNHLVRHSSAAESFNAKIFQLECFCNLASALLSMSSQHQRPCKNPITLQLHHPVLAG